MLYEYDLDSFQSQSSYLKLRHPSLKTLHLYSLLIIRIYFRKVIEEELNSTLIYQIEDLKNITIEAREVFELSSSVLVTVNSAKSLYNSIQETGKNTLDAVQFWKDNKEIAEIETDIKKDFKKDLAASQEKLENLPDELALQSIDTVTSINNIQKELQTIKVAQMIISQ
ncbi:hypothetical protein [Planococcus halotolerans]|uniref:Uncharacterized protein n=1 Tax=Planococcus halotolerans TaxID=2233542 RepID=A0A365L7Z6_9BACL|nr:hypothetical protein [Planococcus halotolerans]RAZ81520.1 hypothetical protein DP120_04395 [Planococcus halotolerans]